MIILASQSPRRLELMKKITGRFEAVVSGVEEILPEELTDPFAACEYLAALKAGSVAQDHPHDLVVGCDTVVIQNGCIFGKPRDCADAARMLRSLSGTFHDVCTGVAICWAGGIETFREVTRVYFHELTQEQINWYTATDEPYDKAGAYAIQGLAGRFVRRYDGDYDNVVGFPTERIRGKIQNHLKKEPFCGITL